MEIPTHFVKMKVIWVDDELIEVRIEISNKWFSGIGDVYLTDSFAEFVQNLKGYPKDLSDNDLSYEYVQYNSFSINFFIKYGKVRLGVEIIDDPSDGNNRIHLEMYVEPASIDTFQKQLVSILKNRDGEALLIGFE